MKKTIIILLSVLLSLLFCACSIGTQKETSTVEDPKIKFQGTWSYIKTSNAYGSVIDELSIDGINANYTRVVTFMGGVNTSIYANYELQIQDGAARLIYIEGYGITEKIWDLTVSENALIAKSDSESITFIKQ